MLLEGPAGRDVQELHAAADAEHGDVALQRAPRERDLEVVARPVDAARLGVAVGAVRSGIDVASAGEQEAVDEVEHLVRLAGGDRVGREHQRESAGALHRDRVAVGKHVREGLRPRAPSPALDRGAHADHRPRRC